MRISLRSLVLGLVVGEGLLLFLSNLGLGLANAAFGATSRYDGGVVGVASLVAVIAGGLLAARIAGRSGLWHGLWVGAGFIAVGAIFQFLQEANIVHASLATGSHVLVDLGPMNMGSLISGDFLALFGGCVGGLLARRP